MPGVVVGYDGRAEGRDALALGKLLAAPTGERLILVAVFPYSSSWMGEEAFESALRDDEARVFAEVREGLAEDAETRALAGGSPAMGLQDVADAEDASLIAIGSTHRGVVGRVLSGTVADRLMHGAPCPIAIAPRGFQSDPSLTEIGVGFDGARESWHALAFAADLARQGEARVHLLGVLESLGSELIAYRAAEISEFADVDAVDSERRKVLAHRLDVGLSELDESLRGERYLLSGEPAEELAAGAGRASLDLLVVGSRGYGPLRRVLLGGVSSRLARSASCPLVVVPRPA